MSNVGTLLKYNLLNSYPIINKLNKKKNKSSAAILGLIVFIYLLIIAFVTLYMFIFQMLFVDLGVPDTILSLGILLTALMLFFTTLTKANSYLFRCSDNDLLLALPVTHRDILISKFVSLYVYSFIFSFATMVSTGIVYAITVNCSFIFIIQYLFLIILIPIIPIVLSSFFAFLFGFIPISQKVKNSLTTVLYIVFLVVYVLGMTGTNDDQVPNLFYNLTTVFNKVYIFGNWALRSINGEYIYLLYFALATLAIGAIFVFVVAKLFMNFKNLMNRTKNKKNFKLKESDFSGADIRNTSTLKTLLIKETRLYFGIPAYVVNTIAGPILAILFSITLASQFKDGNYAVLNEMVGFELNPEVIMVAIMAIYIFCASLTSTSSSSISLEGKNFWILKAAPVREKDVFLAKILLNVILIVPFIIIGGIIAAVVVKANLLVTIISIMVPAVYGIAVSIFGLYINLLVPVFEFDNPIKIVKQSKSTLFIMLLSFALTIIVGLSTIFLIIALGPLFTVIIEFAISLVFLAISIALIVGSGVKKYQNLSA